MTSSTNPSNPFDAAADTDKATEAARVQAQLDRVSALTPERRRSRFKLQGSTVILAALVLAGAGFVAGAQVGTNVQKNRATTTGAGTGGFGRGGGFGGGNAGAASGAGAERGGATDPLAAALSQASATTTVPAGPQVTGGSITLVDGSTIYVETPSGETLIVETDSSTKISKTTEGALESLVEGAQIFLSGTSNESGELQATEVVVAPGAAAQP